MAKAKTKAETPKDNTCPQCSGEVSAEDAITYETHGPFCGVDCAKQFQIDYLAS